MPSGPSTVLMCWAYTVPVLFGLVQCWAGVCNSSTRPTAEEGLQAIGSIADQWSFV